MKMATWVGEKQVDQSQFGSRGSTSLWMRKGLQVEALGVESCPLAAWRFAPNDGQAG